MRFLALMLLGVILASCGTRVPLNNALIEEFGLDNEKAIRKVQFYTSTTIILEKTKQSGSQGIDDGKLVTSTNKDQNRIIIPSGTKCLFDSYGENGEIIVRFEVGQGRVLPFAMKGNTNTSKFFLVAQWNNGRNGGTLSYGNDVYNATNQSGAAYLQVLKNKLAKSKRKDRVVKGMKI